MARQAALLLITIHGYEIPNQAVSNDFYRHILKRLHLLDDASRKRGMDGMVYAVQPAEVIDMMRRYEVAVIQESC